MKKKLFAVLVVVMVLLTACGGSKNDSIEPEVNTTIDTQSEPVGELKTEENKDAEPEDTAKEDESKTVEDDTKPEAAAEPETTEGDKQEEEASDSENYETLEEAFENPDLQTEIDSLIASMEDETMSISYDVKKNNFIITYKFLESSVKADTDGLAEALTEALEGLADTFKNMAATFDELVVGGEGTCTITVRSTDPDDNVIAEQTFGND